jgi:hypothetical protein
MATITGVWEWRIVGGGEDRRHINSAQWYCINRLDLTRFQFPIAIKNSALIHFIQKGTFLIHFIY